MAITDYVLSERPLSEFPELAACLRECYERTPGDGWQYALRKFHDYTSYYVYDAAGTRIMIVQHPHVSAHSGYTAAVVRCPDCRQTVPADTEFTSLHGRDACPACVVYHDAQCCPRCASVGQCPVHAFTSDPACDYHAGG